MATSVPTVTARRRITAKELTPQSFSAYGSVISTRHQLADRKTISANYGTAVKLFQVCPVVNNYAQSSRPATVSTNLNLFRSSPPLHLIKFDAGSNKGVYSCKVVERHPYSSQTFMPMGRDRREVAYMVVVAKTRPDGLPDTDQIEAFLVTGDQSVTYAAGTWHAPMVALNETVDFAVLVHENGIANDDCQETYLEGLEVEFATEGPKARL